MSDVENKVYRPDNPDVNDVEPETWKETDGGRILVYCKHGNPGMIKRSKRGAAPDPLDWNIAIDGTVKPSVYWQGSCECHIWLRLEGWKP